MQRVPEAATRSPCTVDKDSKRNVINIKSVKSRILFKPPQFYKACFVICLQLSVEMKEMIVESEVKDLSVE